MRSLLFLFLLLPGLALAQSPGDGPGPPPSPVHTDSTGALLLPTADGAIGARVLSPPAITLPVETLTLLSGIAGAGATLLCSSTVSSAVACNIVAQGLGDVTFGNGAGTLASLSSVPVLGGGYMTLLGATGDMAINPSGNGRLVMNVPDGTATGGNQRGVGALDLQRCRAVNTQIVGGANGAIIGGCNNSAQAPNSGGVAGFGNNLTGSYSFYGGGINGADDGRFATRVYSQGFLASLGDRQLAETTLSGVSTASAAVRLTGNAATASTATKNCWNLPTGKITAVRATLAGTDFTTAAHHVGYFVNLIVFREIAGTMGIAVGTPEVLGTDTVTVSLTADGTNSCLNATVTADNADTWHWTMTLYAAEAK